MPPFPEEDNMPRLAKKLRCMEPDLTIVVGEGDNQQQHQSYKILMASESNYIDTMLAASMQESQTSQISFPDIDPKTWDDMILCLDPERVRSMEASLEEKFVIDRALKLAVFYDKYEFHNGMLYCSSILNNYLKVDSNWHGTALPRTIEILSKCSQLSLDCCNSTRTKKLELILRGEGNDPTILKTLSRDDLANLIRLFEKYESLFHSLHFILGHWLQNKETAFSNPMFADVLYERVQNCYLKRQLERQLSLSRLQNLRDQTYFMDSQAEADW